MLKTLRFAALVRVSTDKQEKKGESLRTQTKQIDEAVSNLNGRIVARYAGQEHATPGWEREQRDKLLSDAEKTPRPFDAVIVAHQDRWSRDDTRSGADLERLKRAGVRFFVLKEEQDLSDPTTLMYLGISAVIGAYHARNQNKKSIQNRIERAKRGIPTVGKNPFGRRWDEKQQTWIVDSAKREMIADVAKRYLAGESLSKLAEEYGQNHANLCKVLRERCGTEWVLTFDAPEFNIRETIPLSIPPLLPEKTITAVKNRLNANRTYGAGKPKDDSVRLLSGYVRCATCGYVMFSQKNPEDRNYYRHAHTPRKKACKHHPRPWIRAELIEKQVIDRLFKMFGNSAALEAAVKSAIPDCGELETSLKKIETKLEKVAKDRAKILTLVERDALTLDQAEAKLNEITTHESALRQERDKINASLAHLPDLNRVRLHVIRQDGFIEVQDDEGNTYAGGNDVMSYVCMTKKDKRHLIRSSFSQLLPNGEPAGVYLTPLGKKRGRAQTFAYEIRGFFGTLDGVLECASHCTTRDLPSRRSGARSPRPSA